MVVGSIVAGVLFVAAGILAWSSRRVPRTRFQVPLGVGLLVLGVLGWMVWWVIAAAASISATT